MIILVGLMVNVGFSVFNRLGDGADLTRTVGGAAYAIFGAIILIIGILQLLTGIFAWRGSGAARVMGSVLILGSAQGSATSRGGRCMACHLSSTGHARRRGR